MCVLDVDAALLADRSGLLLIADKGYDYDHDYDHLRGWLRSRRITTRIARRGIESGEKLSRHRCVIERSLAWLTGYRRLTLRYERSARLLAAFLPWPPHPPATRSSPRETSS